MDFKIYLAENRIGEQLLDNILEALISMEFIEKQKKNISQHNFRMYFLENAK